MISYRPEATPDEFDVVAIGSNVVVSSKRNCHSGTIDTVRFPEDVSAFEHVFIGL
jgi:hypothetical protein